MLKVQKKIKYYQFFCKQSASKCSYTQIEGSSDKSAEIFPTNNPKIFHSSYAVQYSNPKINKIFGFFEKKR